MSRKTSGRIAAFILLFVLCLFLPARRDAAATVIADGDIFVDYDYETITVDTAQDTVIYFTDVYSDDLEKWYSCEVRNGQASFDISWVKSNVTVRMYICGDVQKKVVSKDITWQEKFGVSFTGTLLTTDITEAERWKAEYAAYPLFSEDTGYFIFTVKENGRDTAFFDLDLIEWRKGDDGVWRPLSELDLKEMNFRGIALNFRIKAVNDTTGAGGTRASTVAKFSLAKLPGAPNTELDTDRMSVNIKNGQEFSLDGKTWTLIPEYDKRSTNEDYTATPADREASIERLKTNAKISSLLVQELLGLKSNVKMDRATFAGYPAGTYTFDAANVADATGVFVYVRDAGDSRRAASRITKILVPFTDPAFAEGKAGDVTISYAESKTATGGILVENLSDLKYQVAIVTPEEQVGIAWDDVDVSELKWTTLRPEKVTKLAYNKVPKGSYLLYRISGDKETLPSTYVRSIQLNYDHVTYAGVAQENKVVGDVLTAVTSTNLAIGDVTCQWQRCRDIKADTPVWEEIGTGITYNITGADEGCYLRVVISNAKNKMESEPIGPVRARK